MEAELSARLDELQQKIDAVHASAEKTRKMLTWTIILAVALTGLPLLGILFVLPSVVSGYSAALGI